MSYNIRVDTLCLALLNLLKIGFQVTKYENPGDIDNKGQTLGFSQHEIDEVINDKPSFSNIDTAQPSFKKLFISESNFPQILKTKILRPPFRWSRNKSSRYDHHLAPPVLQINAGKRVIQKYRRFARNLEYKRLHNIIPSLSRKKYASKVIIIMRRVVVFITLAFVVCSQFVDHNVFKCRRQESCMKLSSILIHCILN